jgi:FtsP/CotA-like multicopper oxidase with cupredoxin domain
MTPGRDCRSVVDVLRRILIIVLVVVALFCTGVGGLLAWAFTSTGADSTVGKVAFERKLPVPPLAPSTVDADGRRVFDLRAAEGRHDFGAGRRVKTYGFNGDYLGPTLRATRGEKVVVNVHNGLREVTSAHWHGMHLPAAMDGGPHQPIGPGATWSPTWTVDQPAATLWYHPHPHGETADHVYQGLAGMFIVDDPGTDVAALPHEYGVDDIPVIVQDKAFDGDELGSATGMFGSGGVLGDTIAVNGAIGPYLDVTTERVRLRLLNASNVRPYHLGFSDKRPFALVGTDGGLLDAPHETTGVTLVAGERIEIVVTVRPGERVVLRSTPARLNLDWFHERISGANDSFDVLQLRAAPTLRPSPPVPATLVDTPRLDPAQAKHTREFSLSGTSINGKKMDGSRVDAAILKDSVEVWKVTARDGELHTFHVHDVQFQVLSVGGKAPPPHLRGWKDTVFLEQGKEVVIIARFADYADPATPYMFHCHVLRHEDQGMMGQFVVIEPGQVPKVSPGHPDHD